MTDPVERLVNLAMFVAAARTPVTSAHVRARVVGYPAGQDEAAFLRMFERDKEDLLEAGLAFRVERTGDTEGYLLDSAATFARDLTLSPEEAMLLRSAGSAMLGDPSFPFAADLRIALTKVAAACGPRAASANAESTVVALSADEDPAGQASAVAVLADAQAARKRVRFDYTTAARASRRRDVEPYGLYLQGGRWYLVGRDVAAEGMRVFAVARVRDLAANTTRPKTPDFDAPSDFHVRDWMLLPFQYGDERVGALVRFHGGAAARADALARERGVLTNEADGAVLWSVPIADATGLAAWTVENGPGIDVLDPPEARAALVDGLAKVVSDHAR